MPWVTVTPLGRSLLPSPSHPPVVVCLPNRRGGPEAIKMQDGDGIAWQDVVFFVLVQDGVQDSLLENGSVTN